MNECKSKKKLQNKMFMYLLTPIAWQILMRFCKNDKKYYCKISVKFCHTINLTVWFTIFAPRSSHKFLSTILNIHLINVCCLEFQEDFIWMNWKVLYFNKTDRRTKKMIVINILLTHFKIGEKTKSCISSPTSWKKKIRINKMNKIIYLCTNVQVIWRDKEFV